MVNEQDFKELQDEWIHVGMVSTYLMMVEKKSMGMVCDLLEKHDKPFSFFLAPIEVQNRQYGEQELNDMIEHFIEKEDYRKCAELKKILTKIKINKNYVK